MLSTSAQPEKRPVTPISEALPALSEDESPLAADERAYEALEALDNQDGFLEQVEDAPTSSVTPAASATDDVAPAVVAPAKDEVTLEMEKILEDGLGEYVSSMPEEARVRFLYKGQETAQRLALMVQGVKVQAKKVVDLIRDWLLTIPGVSKFFLEQEAKIKTDRVLQFDQAFQEKKKNTL
jgi:hypothetical protein